MDDLNILREVDVNSMILFVLYQISNVKEYHTLSELAYILDKKNLMKFLDYFGGMTIKVPTKEEMQLVVNALLVYQGVVLENKTVQESFSSLKTLSPKQKEKVKLIYKDIERIMEKYYLDGTK